MTRFMAHIVVTAFCAFWNQANHAQVETTGKADPPAVAWDNLDARMKWEADNGFSGVVLVARDGQIVFNKAFGFANKDKNIPMKLDTIFGIGSTPIDFTRASILMLAERGKLSLSDPITKYFPNVPDDKKSITLQHLMTGRSGLQDFHDIPSDRDPDHSWIDRDEALKRVFDQELVFAPGAKRQHSHSAFGVLAAIIEIVTGQSYQDFTRVHLFKPAGMTDTGFFGAQYDENRMAIGYGPRKDGDINAPPYWGKTSWLVMGSGGQVSTAPDMWRWAQAIYGGKLVKPETIQQYMNPRQGMLVGGDMYGFEIMGAGDHRNAMIIMYNNGSPRRNPPLRKLGEALTALVTGRVTAKFTLGVELQVEENEPIKVARVVPGGAAEKAGLLAGDILHSANGKPIGDPPMAILAPLLQTADAIAFVIERNGEKQTIKVTPLPRGG